MKYKLINSVTKIETICDKVTIDGFDYYVSDEQIMDTDNYLNLEIKPNGQKNPFWGKIYKKYSITKDEKYEKYVSQFCKKVIATTNPNNDIPKVVDEVEEITKDERYSNSFRIGFKHGYNKSQETHPNSDEDVIEFMDWYKSKFVQIYDKKTKLHQISLTNPKTELTTKEILQLWKDQQPKTVYYE